MNESIIKASQTVELLLSDLREICKSSNSPVYQNDALCILSSMLIENATKIQTVLSQLQRQ